MSRAERREAERVALRALRRRDPWAVKLHTESVMLHALGYLGADGEVHCPLCGRLVDRQDGWAMVFSCPCGWLLVDDVEGFAA